MTPCLSLFPDSKLRAKLGLKPLELNEAKKGESRLEMSGTRLQNVKTKWESIAVLFID